MVSALLYGCEVRTTNRNYIKTETLKNYILKRG